MNTTTYTQGLQGMYGQQPYAQPQFGFGQQPQVPFQQPYQPYPVQLLPQQYPIGMSGQPFYGQPFQGQQQIVPQVVPQQIAIELFRLGQILQQAGHGQQFGVTVHPHQIAAELHRLAQFVQASGQQQVSPLGIQTQLPVWA